MENLPNISINLIVKNEEKRIADAINSVKLFASEIIVIDTGSTDSTPQICTRMGCEVYYHSWNDNFSEMRNIALGYSSMEWILVIDSDEVARFSLLDLPLEQMNDPKIGGINLQIINHIDENDDSIISKHRYTRLFRNDKSVRFTGRIHEQIRESIEGKFEIYDSELIIEHFGYRTIDKEKLERNTRLLEQDIEADADDWKYYHLAETLFSGGDKDKSRTIFERIVSSPELTDLQLDRVKTRLGQLYLGSDRYNEAESILSFVSEDKDTEGLRQYVLAAVKLSTGFVDEALVLYNSRDIELSDLVDKNQLKVALQGAKQYKSIIEKK
ncbi:MAG: glycosyltransferase family 2 protein [Candidatus Kapaibacterium sp.]